MEREPSVNSSSRQENIQKAIGILRKLFSERRLHEQRGKKILIDPATGFFVVGEGKAAVENVLEQRRSRKLPHTEEIAMSFVSLPMNLDQVARIEDGLLLVRDTLKNILKSDAEREPKTEKMPRPEKRRPKKK